MQERRLVMYARVLIQKERGREICQYPVVFLELYDYHLMVTMLFPLLVYSISCDIC